MLSATAPTLSEPTPITARVSYAGASDVGLYRLHNEDRFGIFPELGLFLIADGLGGAPAGEVAAQMAIDRTHDAFTEILAHPLPALIAAVQRANHDIHASGQARFDWRGMGTTLVALLVRGDRAVLAHAGDSRVYRLRAGVLAQMTDDHSLWNRMIRTGLADAAHPEAFAHGHIVTRALGIHPSVDVDARMIEVIPGDTFLLCSDGLTNVVSHDELRAILLDETHLEGAVERLIAHANQRGGPDNITAVLVRCRGPATSPARS